MSAGVAHSLFCSANGGVYSWGLGYGGRLGHGDEDSCKFPRRLRLAPDVVVVQAAAGSGSSVLVAADGRLFTFGRGERGQLGHGDRASRFSPTVVEALRGHHVIHASMGEAYTVVTTDKGEAFSWGANGHGQLGHGDTEERLVPVRIAAMAGQTCVQVSGESS